MTRRFATELSIIIGPDRDIPAPDVYTNSQTLVLNEARRSAELWGGERRLARSP